MKDVIEVLEKLRSKISGLSCRGLKSFTRYGEEEMRSRAFDAVNDEIRAILKERAAATTKPKK